MTSLDTLIRISTRLDQLHMTIWFTPLLKWLSIYEGLHDFMESDPSPESQLLEFLSNLQPEQRTDSILVSMVDKLDFLKWRVEYIGGPRWNPCEETLEDFLNDNQDQKPYAFTWDTIYPSKKDIVNKLNDIIMQDLLAPIE